MECQFSRRQPAVLAVTSIPDGQVKKQPKFVGRKASPFAPPTAFLFRPQTRNALKIPEWKTSMFANVGNIAHLRHVPVQRSL